MAVMERKRAVWLTFYGVFIALLIQVLYEWGGFLVPTLRIAIGLGIACSGLIPLAIYVSNGYQWKKKQKVNSVLPKDEKITPEEPKAVGTKTDWNSQRESLIVKVDAECKKKRFTAKRLKFVSIIIGTSLTLAIILVAFNFVIVSTMLSYSQLLNDTTPTGNQTIPAGLSFLAQQLPTVDGIFVGIVAFLASIMAIVIPLILGISTPADLADEYYEKISQTISDVEKPFLPHLKALINMKCKEFDVSLLDNYHNSIRLKTNSFSEKLLLKNLYSD